MTAIFKIIKQYLWCALLAAAASAGCAVVQVGISDMLKRLVDLSTEHHFSDMKMTVIIGVMIIIFGMAVNYISVYVTGYFGTRILQKLRKVIVEHLIKTKPDYMERNGFGDTLGKLTQDIESIRAFTENYLSDFIYVPVMTVIFSIYLAILSPLLLIGTMLPVIIIVPLSTHLLTPIKLSQKQYSRMLGNANDNIKEVCDGSGVIKAFRMENAMYERFESRLTDCLKLAQRNDRLQYHVIPMTNMIMDLPQMIGLCAGGYLVITHRMSAGSLVAFVSLLKFLIEPLTNAYQIWVNSKSTLANVERVASVLEEPVEYDSEDVGKNPMQNKAKQNRNNTDNVYELNQVNFAYDEINLVLENINLNIKRGTRVALVGMSGSGKSTLLKLLYRHYDSYDGTIRFCDADLKSLAANEIREHISLIAQDSYVFPISIEDNIRIGNPAADRKQIMEAAKQANCHDFISRLPDGYNTNAGENGSLLSGGQLQRIAIARAILKNSDIYLLDEPTSALDELSERLVNQAVDHICSDRSKTVITVAHRLSTIKDYDEIIMFEKGKIIERGTHENLLKAGGQYAAHYQSFQ